MKGLDAALAAPRAEWPDEIVVFGAATEAFSQKNINCSIAESIERFRPVVAAAQRRASRCAARSRARSAARTRARSAPTRSSASSRLMKEIGVDHCGVADTIGVGTPKRVQAAMERALRALIPIAEVSGHFHDTYGQAIGNVYASLEVGIATFDASVAGLGGCPYAKGATGNVATEDVLFLLDGLGIDTGVSHRRTVVDAAAFISGRARQEAGLAGCQRDAGASAALGAPACARLPSVIVGGAERVGRQAFAADERALDDVIAGVAMPVEIVKPARRGRRACPSASPGRRRSWRGRRPGRSAAGRCRAHSLPLAIRSGRRPWLRNGSRVTVG